VACRLGWVSTVGMATAQVGVGWLESVAAKQGQVRVTEGSDHPLGVDGGARVGSSEGEGEVLAGASGSPSSLDAK
jgi:hypothetical protein